MLEPRGLAYGLHQTLRCHGNGEKTDGKEDSCRKAKKLLHSLPPAAKEKDQPHQQLRDIQSTRM